MWQTAYVAKSADVLSLLLGLPTEWSGVGFVGVFGTFLLLGGTIVTDYVNQAATATMIVLFLVMVRLLLSRILPVINRGEYFMHTSNQVAITVCPSRGE